MSKELKQKIATGFLVLLSLITASKLLILFAEYWYWTIPSLVLLIAIRWSLKQLAS